MSLPRLVRNSPDLSRLVDEGYAVRVHAGHLIIDDIPFVTAAATVVRGGFICPLDTQGDTTAQPGTHVMWFTHIPCSSDGTELTSLIHQQGPFPLAAGVDAACSSSQKAHGQGYANFYDKVIAYAGLVVGHAQALDPAAVATTFRPVMSDEPDSIFNYLDTNSSRAGITDLAERVAVPAIAIVGLGGTGSYLLDLLVKTPIHQLHLYDGDVFSTHNSYRAPGAATAAELNAAPSKVHHHARRYQPLRRGIIAHDSYVTVDNVTELLTMDFVFLAMDANPDKQVIVETLTASDIPFIDTGIGVRRDAGGLAGLLRVTHSFPEARHHIEDDQLISYQLGDDAEYESNIQVAELNALAAALAVIGFKKRYGFYADVEHELHFLYRIDSNELINRYGAADREDADEA